MGTERMQPRVDVLTLGVRDLDRSRRFYVDGLGWEPVLDVPGEVIFVQIGHGLLLSLWGVDDLSAEAGGVGHGPTAAPMSLGHIVPDEQSVGQVIDRAVAAGATAITSATRRDWGGVSGYFADPDGFRWEVAYNPGFSVAADGTVRIAAVDG
ncbi:VOC family protein [Speluncibacter jeojiensis]|uniref:VOC family protein n=1 Tax=Speluncibacter jeojiensis TaxID=2710754 RepID=A0A9X4M1E1_9ACTN|nr:VOC family protein [Rhodococcus sp. D2-41]MDG3015401.1 VOC family protein [Corynebacteriales bacterium D3-21]